MTRFHDWSLGFLLLFCLSPAAAQEPLLMNVLSFDGKSGYVELPANLFDRLEEGTIELWVKWQSFQNWSRVIDFGHEENAFVVQNEKKGNTVNFAIWDEGGRRHRVQAKKRVRKGVWHHLAMVFGRSGMAFYIDGDLVGTDAYEGGPNVAAGGVGTTSANPTGRRTSCFAGRWPNSGSGIDAFRPPISRASKGGF